MGLAMQSAAVAANADAAKANADAVAAAMMEIG